MSRSSGSRAISTAWTPHAWIGSRCRAGPGRASSSTSRDQRIWSANSRVEQLEAETGDGQVQEITLKDVRGASRFDFKAPVETSWLRLTIKSVYPGSKYRDTAISELYPIFAD